MTTGSSRYALLTNGSPFSLAVLGALLDQDIPPALIVLPEYPPAASVNCGLPAQLAEVRDNPLRQLAANIPVAYAPEARQVTMKSAFENQHIEVMLVACWPYLLDSTIADHLAGAAINLHPSKLPLFRGPDPIGEQLTSAQRPFGVSLHKLSDKFDQGDLVAQADVTIEDENADRKTLEMACARAGVLLFAGLLQRQPAAWHSWSQAG